MFIKENNMKNKVLILGAGGMAREVFQIYIQSNKKSEVIGFLVSQKKVNYSVNSLKVYDKLPDPKGIKLINGIGSPLRKKWILKLLTRGFVFDNIIHPSAIVSEECSFGFDIVISANCIISCNVIIGNHVIVNLNATISHDSKIGDYSTLSPGVNIGGNVKVGSGTFIGIGADIIQGVTIGSNVFIGAGSVVVSDIPDNVLVYGNPAKVIRRLGEEELEKLI